MHVVKEICHVCGNMSDFTIDDGATLLREAKCNFCGASIRNSDVAKQVINFLNCKEISLNNCLQELPIKEILNTCSSGAIHNALKTYAGYTCSEYFDDVSVGEYVEGILNVDLTEIPFKNNTFDIIISEDVFEHIDDYHTAFLEIYRVLKPGGVHIFTVPIHEAYLTESRSGKKEVYHGNPNPQNGTEGSLVITDWGYDIQNIVSQYGFDVSVVMAHKFYLPNEITKVDEEYQTYLKYRNNLEKYQKYNSIVIVANKPRDNKSEEAINKAYEGIHKDIRKYNREICKKNEMIYDLNNEIESRGKHIQKLDKDIEFARSEVNRLNVHIENLSAWGQSLDAENEILKKEWEISKQAELSLQEKIEKIENEFNNKLGHIELLLESERQLQRQVQELQTELNNKQGHIELLLESDRKLEQIYQSTGWKVLTKCYRVRDSLLPQGSKRRFVLKLAKNFIRKPGVYLRKLNWANIKKLRYYASAEGMENLNNRLDAFDEKYNAVQAELIEVQQVEVQEQYETLVFPKVEHPTVSIIIPVYNQFHYTYACLKSILENTQDVSYEVIIADDVSTDQTVNIKDIVKNITVVRNEQNMRFLLNCNNAAKHAKGKYIHFLNNDTQVQDKWLSSLVQLIESDETIGMVGSKLVYPDGRLQEAGGILWRDGSAWNYGHLSDPTAPEFNYVKEADYISGASIMITKALWEQIGGFDEHFVPAYYEDTDLAFEVRAQGYKVMYQPLSVVVHFEGVSNGTDTSSGQKQYQVVNAKKFYEKWKDILEREHVANGTQVFKAKDKSLHKKHILVVDHYVPHYDQDAGGKCTWMYMKLFLSLGMKVTFIGDNYYKHEPYATELMQMGVEFLYGDYYYLNWKAWLEQNGHNFDYAYLNRPHISEKYIDILKKHSDCKIIYFGHDLHYLREQRQYEIDKNPAILKSSEDWKKKEFALFQKADVVYVVGSYEQNILQCEIHDKPVRNIPVYIYDQLKENVNMNFAERKDLLFVGGFGHYPNVDAVLWFAEYVFPSVKAAYPNIKWYIVGSKPTAEIQQLADDNIIVTGFIEDAELERLYATCRLAVVPLRIGAGVKGKVVEAVYNKIPLLTSPIGAEGLSLAEEAFVVADCDDSMADKIIALYKDYDALGRLSANCDSFIENHFTLDVAKSIVLQDVT